MFDRGLLNVWKSQLQMNDLVSTTLANDNGKNSNLIWITLIMFIIAGLFAIIILILLIILFYWILLNKKIQYQKRERLKPLLKMLSKTSISKLFTSLKTNNDV